MKQLANFLLLFLLLGFSSSSCEPAKRTDSSYLTPEELAAKKGELVLIDVRTPQEFASGHIEGALNINMLDENFKNELEALDRTKAVSVYCKVGSRSARAAAIMREMGFEEVYDLEGGIRNWNRSGMEIVK
jgi:rhodanese-related sulfurtransferase